MITVIRKHLIHNKAYKGLVWAVGIVLAVSLGLPGVMGKSLTEPWVVTVNGSELTYNDYVRKVMEQENNIRAFRQRYRENAEIVAQLMGILLDPQALAIESFVGQELFNQVVRNGTFYTHDDYLQEKLGDIGFIQTELAGLVPPHAFDQTNGIDVTKLRPYLKRMHLSMADFDEQARAAAGRYFVKRLVFGGVYVPQAVLHERYKQEFSRKKYSLVTFAHSEEGSQQAVKAQQGLKNGQSWKEVAAQGKTERFELVNGNDEKQVKDLQSKSIGVPMLLEMTQPGMVVVQGNKLIRLDEIEEPTAAMIESKRSDLQASLDEESGRLLLGSFVASLHRTATIKRNESISHQQKEYSI